MHSNRETGRFLQSQRPVLAEAVVARQYELQPELRERYGEGGQAKCVQDTEYHLSYLATAVAFTSPILFVEYIAWAKTVLAAYGVGTEDVERNLLCLRDVLNEKLSDDMREAAIGCVEDALKALPEPTSAPASFLDGEDDLTQLAREYLQALLRVERHEAIRLIYDALRTGVAVQDIYLRVFQCCQREVGRLWQLKQITVAQEHCCTATTQLAMSQLYPYLFTQPRNGRRLVASSVSGELHEVGLRIVTDLFESEGWDTMYLGANLPAEGVLHAVTEYRPDLLLISATMTFHLEAVERLIALVRSSEAGKKVKIMVGGYPCNVDPDLWMRVGADGYACDATEALATADRLLNLHEPEHPTGGRPDEERAVIRTPHPGGGPQSQGETAVYDELSRLNNELLTTQRELARKNSQLERLNERLNDADRRKDEFLATLAHELRNPLAPIRTGLELMRMAKDDQTLLDEVHTMMEGQTQHLVRLVDDLLDVSRITSGKITLRKFRVELATVVQSAVDATRRLIEEAGHELTITLPNEPTLVEADPTRLAQVISNLLTNAARYTEYGGRIWLRAECQEGLVVVAVRDTGVGIPAEMLDRIFEMFMQVDRSGERTQSGLGIGLMLVKRLTELHGGSVEARSAGPGKGSEFIVRLPVLIEPAQEPQPRSEEDMVESGRLRIVVVDDNKAAAKMLSTMLRAMGNELRTTYDGLEAIDVAAEFCPDVMLMDLGMPRLNGYDTARRIREQPWGQRTLLVALTGWGQEEDKQRTKEAGFDYHLVKPVELSTLQELLAQVASRESGH